MSSSVGDVTLITGWIISVGGVVQHVRSRCPWSLARILRQCVTLLGYPWYTKFSGLVIYLSAVRHRAVIGKVFLVVVRTEGWKDSDDTPPTHPQQHRQQPGAACHAERSSNWCDAQTPAGYALLIIMITNDKKKAYHHDFLNI